MSVIQMHPEALLARDRAGTLSDSERRVLDAHVETCVQCAIERVARRAFDSAGAPKTTDDELCAHAVSVALTATGATETGATNATTASAAPTAPTRTSTGNARRLLPRRVWLMGVAAVMVTTGAAAAILRSWNAPAHSVPHAEHRASARSVAVPTPPPAPIAAPVPEQPTATQAPPPPDVATTPRQVHRGAPTTATVAVETAGALFASANAARSAGRNAEALGLYSQLRGRFPDSREASVSHVSVGRLMLDRLGNPGGALAQFDAYLRDASRGELREEALIGRALALERLGRRSDEHQAWALLLRDYPDSISAGRARARLGELTNH